MCDHKLKQDYYFLKRNISTAVRRRVGRHAVPASCTFIPALCGLILPGMGGVGLLPAGVDSGFDGIYLATNLLWPGMPVLSVLFHGFAVIRANSHFCPQSSLAGR
ncbi:MAG TPA: hypothetical protein VJ944_01930 [Thermoplasmataceae archaeon]|nr:hypothetical protein [Thermoplasmataceae archaeon]